MLRTLALAALVFALPLLGTPTSLYADDADPIVIEVVDVGALAGGLTEYLGARVGLFSVDDVNSEDSPLFGAEDDDVFYPSGSVDHVVSYLMEEILDPAQVEDGRADIVVLRDTMLILKMPRSQVARVTAAIQELESLARTTLLTDIVLVPSRDVAGKEDVRDLGREWQLPASAIALRASSAPGQRVTGWTGGQQAFLQDFDVEVAEKSKVPDPIVSALNTGLSVDMRAYHQPGTSHALIETSGAYAHLLALARHATDEDLVLETPSVHKTSLDFGTQVTLGTWHVLDRVEGPGEPWLVVVRVSADPGVPPATAPPQGMTVAALSDESAALTRKLYDVQDLTVRAISTRPTDIPYLTPSNYTPREPSELEEPYPLFPIDTLPDLIGVALGQGALARKGVKIESGVLGHHLSVRGTPEMHARVEAALAHLRGRMTWQVETEVEVVLVDRALANALQSSSRAHLDTQTAEAVTAARLEGRATRLGGLRLQKLQGAIRGSAVGIDHSYLADFEVEIANGAWIANPIMQILRAGTRATIQAQLTSDRQGARLQWQVLQTHLHQPMREARTPHGPLQAPKLDVSRTAGSAYVPFGTTVVGAIGRAGDQATLTLLTPRLIRPAR